MNLPDRSSQGIASWGRLGARRRQMTAIEEELACNSHAQPFHRKRFRYMRRSAGIAIESIPNRRPEVRDDLCRYARTLFYLGRLTQSDVDVIPFQEGVLTVDAFPCKAERESVIMLCVKHERFKRHQIPFAQFDCAAACVHRR